LETTDFLTESVLDFPKRLEGSVRTCFFPELVPQMFNWIEFRTVWRLREQAYVLRDFQMSGFVPTCLIHLHNDQELTEIFGYFL